MRLCGASRRQLAPSAASAGIGADGAPTAEVASSPGGTAPGPASSITALPTPPAPPPPPSPPPNGPTAVPSTLGEDGSEGGASKSALQQKRSERQ